MSDDKPAARESRPAFGERLRFMRWISGAGNLAPLFLTAAVMWANILYVSLPCLALATVPNLLLWKRYRTARADGQASPRVVGNIETVHRPALMSCTFAAAVVCVISMGYAVAVWLAEVSVPTIPMRIFLLLSAPVGVSFGMGMAQIIIRSVDGPEVAQRHSHLRWTEWTAPLWPHLRGYRLHRATPPADSPHSGTAQFNVLGRRGALKSGQNITALRLWYGLLLADDEKAKRAKSMISDDGETPDQAEPPRGAAPVEEIRSITMDSVQSWENPGTRRWRARASLDIPGTPGVLLSTDIEHESYAEALAAVEQACRQRVEAEKRRAGNQDVLGSKDTPQ